MRFDSKLRIIALVLAVLSVAGLMLSLAVHGLVWLGRLALITPGVLWLGLGAIVVGSATNFCLTLRYYDYDGWWYVNFPIGLALRECPPWMSALAYGVAGYPVLLMLLAMYIFVVLKRTPSGSLTGLALSAVMIMLFSFCLAGLYPILREK